jgi:tetratricopeptide (TPR) repeat protein
MSRELQREPASADEWLALALEKQGGSPLRLVECFGPGTPDTRSFWAEVAGALLASNRPWDSVDAWRRALSLAPDADERYTISIEAGRQWLDGWQDSQVRDWNKRETTIDDAGPALEFFAVAALACPEKNEPLLYQALTHTRLGDQVRALALIEQALTMEQHGELHWPVDMKPTYSELTSEDAVSALGLAHVSNWAELGLAHLHRGNTESAVRMFARSIASSASPLAEFQSTIDTLQAEGVLVKPV